jgi:hypothetical protein
MSGSQTNIVSTIKIIINPVLSSPMSNVTGETVSTPISTVIRVTSPILLLATVSLTATEPVTLIPRNLGNQLSLTRTNPLLGEGCASASALNLPFSQQLNQGINRNYPYGMPTTLMHGLHKHYIYMGAFK